MKIPSALAIAARRRTRPLRTLSLGAAIAALAVVAAACGGSSNSSTPSQSAAHAGGTFTILANSAFGVADPAQNYTLEEWQLLIDTHDGLVGFAKAGGGQNSQRWLADASCWPPCRRIAPVPQANDCASAAER